jgi:IS5 family transposase/transposase
VTLGLSDRQGNLFDEIERFCDKALDETSIYAFMHRERDRLFPDEEFADLFDSHGRRSVPPSVVATVMVLQRLEGLSDREAVERYCYDNRWRYAAGVGGYDTAGWTSFSHTVLVDMRERLRRSERPDRIFEATLEAAKQAGLIGHRRALDSTPLYDAVATMDTVTLIRSAVRALLKVAGRKLRKELQGVLTNGDDYTSSSKPQIDWDDAQAREVLIDSRAKDAYACLGVLHGKRLDAAVTKAAELLANVTGQDLTEGDDGIFRIARKVAKDRVISTVDPEARHGHKTTARSFDGYKGHVAVDPDSEIITAVVVTPGNAGDASVATDLIADLLADDDTEHDDTEHDDTAEHEPPTVAEGGTGERDDATTVYGDNAYGTGKLQALLDKAGITSRCKTQQPTAPGGLFSKDRFAVDLDKRTVTCPAGVTVRIRGHLMAYFGEACSDCPLQSQCTGSAGGRTIGISPFEEALSRARARQSEQSWRDDYRATRPKVERKIAHLTYRRHGGRRARVRGVARVGADFRLLAAAANLARLARLGLGWTATAWAIE